MSEHPSTIIDFRNIVQTFYAGDPSSYSAIVILTWQEIDEAQYNQVIPAMLKQ